AELSAGSTSGPTSISAPISGLQGAHTYHFRVVAKNSLGTSVAKDKEFTTPPAVDSVVTEDPTDVTRTTAMLNGSFDGGTNDTPPGPLEGFHYYFEWGPTTEYGNETAAPPGVDAGPHDETVQVSAEIEDLSVYLPDSQPYHYRLVVSNSTGV